MSTQDKLFILGAKYMGISVEDFKYRMNNLRDKQLSDWEKFGIEKYYNETEAYIYGLVLFNDEFRIDNLLHPIKHLKGQKILDYGAGIGIIPILLAETNITYYYDVESKTKEFAKFINNNSKTKTTFIDKEKTALNLDLDIIICVDVLEHLKDPISLVKKFTETLHEGGLFLTTGLDFSIGAHIPMHLKSNIAQRPIYNKYMGEHYNLFFYHSTKNESIFLWSKKKEVQ